MTKVRHSQSRTVQVKQYEPRVFTFEIEDEVDSEAVVDALTQQKWLIDQKIDLAVLQLQTDLKKEKENSQ